MIRKLSSVNIKCMDDLYDLLYTGVTITIIITICF